MQNKQPPLLVNTLTRKERQVASLIKEVKKKHQQLKQCYADYSTLFSKFQRLNRNVDEVANERAKDVLRIMSPEVFLLDAYRQRVTELELETLTLNRQLHYKEENIEALKKKVRTMRIEINSRVKCEKMLKESLRERDAQILELKRDVRALKSRFC